MFRETLAKLLIPAVIAGGAAAVAFALYSADSSRVDLAMIALFAVTIGVGSRITIKLPRFNSYVAASDIFIFLTLLQYGGAFAIVLAAGEAFASSWRFCKKKVTVVFNAATMALSIAAVVLALKALGLYGDIYFHSYREQPQHFIIALSAIAVTQFIVNTSLASIYSAIRDAANVWETWKTKYLWTFFTYFIGAAGAGLLIQVTDTVGLGIVVATFPVFFFVFYSYRMYMQNVEMSMHQAEQAKDYAEKLEIQAEKVRESEERFRSAFNFAPIGIGLVSPSGEWLKVNLALTQILGYSEDEFLRTDFQTMTFPEDLGTALVLIHEILSGKVQSHQMEQRYRHKSGKTVWGSWSVSAASRTDGEKPNLIFQIQDITDKKVAEERLQHEATHDVLTGLPNRSLFMTKLGEALEKFKSDSRHHVSILFIDLDRFKFVNDSLGHLIGDELLKGIAERLRECMRPSDMVARLGGDEFTILVEGSYDEVEVANIADRIQHRLQSPFDLRGHEVFSSASIGILHASEQHSLAEEMMRDADTAMYQAKRAGKARHETFDEKMHRSVKETLQLETDLRRAVERGEITVVYQPIYALHDRIITGVETLARWLHPKMGHISPSRFIPLAEEIGLIDKLCENVLRQACLEIGSLHDRRSDEPRLEMSVNLSCRQFAQPALVNSICGILDETAFPADRLRLEITESVFFEHSERAVEMLRKMRDIGIQIDIDDFGTGYSNLSYLTKLPISTLKLDRSFVSMIDGSGANDEVVGAIVTLARNLRLNVIAEGIETLEQLEILERLNCDGGQGFYFAPPMRFDEFREFLATTTPYVPIRGTQSDITEIVQ